MKNVHSEHLECVHLPVLLVYNKMTRQIDSLDTRKARGIRRSSKILTSALFLIQLARIEPRPAAGQRWNIWSAGPGCCPLLSPSTGGVHFAILYPVRCCPRVVQSLARRTADAAHVADGRHRDLGFRQLALLEAAAPPSRPLDPQAMTTFVWALPRMWTGPPDRRRLDCYIRAMAMGRGAGEKEL